MDPTLDPDYTKELSKRVFTYKIIIFINVIKNVIISPHNSRTHFAFIAKEKKTDSAYGVKISLSPNIMLYYLHSL